MFNSWQKAVSAYLAALKRLPHDLATELPKLLCCLWQRLHGWLCTVWLCLKRRCKGGDGPGRRPPTRLPSVPISHPNFKRPDPLIYDQYYLMSLGLAVSWQNPDITISQGGVPVASAYDLAPATTYEITATIWNSSPDAVVSGMPVTFSYLSFGVQTQSHFIGATVVDLGVKGSAHCPATAKMLWTTPAVPGHYCIQVSFAWIDDANPLNNLGQDNTQVVQAASPAQFSFDIGNPSRERAAVRFEYDTYAIPTPPACVAGTNGRGNRTVGTVPATAAPLHRRVDFPLPAGWTIVFDPPAPVVPPGVEMPIGVTVTPPDSFHGTLPVNIHAFSGARLLGGVTVLVNRA
jgi:hypothetical protein